MISRMEKGCAPIVGLVRHGGFLSFCFILLLFSYFQRAESELVNQHIDCVHYGQVTQGNEPVYSHGDIFLYFGEPENLEYSDAPSIRVYVKNKNQENIGEDPAIVSNSSEIGKVFDKSKVYDTGSVVYAAGNVFMCLGDAATGKCGGLDSPIRDAYFPGTGALWFMLWNILPWCDKSVIWGEGAHLGCTPIDPLELPTTGSAVYMQTVVNTSKIYRTKNSGAAHQSYYSEGKGFYGVNSFTCDRLGKCLHPVVSPHPSSYLPIEFIIQKGATDLYSYAETVGGSVQESISSGSFVDDYHIHSSVAIGN